MFSIDEDSFDQPATTRKELWSYYLYSNGNNGVGPTSYSQALFQSALSRAGWDPAIRPIHRGNCTTGGCVIPWGSGTRSVSSVILIANGICFTIMTVIFVTLGSAADYGNFGRWLLLFLTIVCWAFQYGLVTIKESSQWPEAMVFYIVSYISYGGMKECSLDYSASPIALPQLSDQMSSKPLLTAQNNNWMGFPFLFALCTLASIIIWFVDVDKGREDCRMYVEERKAVHEREAQRKHIGTAAISQE
ncbi:hypothetical protein EYC84_011664 [Monilinia fructicola]|uniref:Autophagy-related protein n=1 Tax=Monilinia fructicola TaxID=38448 RepID=A0A5M9J4B2_MONFR|nr:hypothetical protein EYC84_011664 [Monilinia fructicola]